MVARVHKILSQWGIASRRQAEKIILAGRVTLNGSVVHLGQKADPSKDIIAVDGVPLQNSSRPRPIYLLLNKPLGVVATCSDPQNRRTVIDLLPAQLRSQQGIHPVGRLDANSTGAILLTNDGQLTLSLTHPRYHLPKTYQVWVRGYPPESILQTWRTGVTLAGKPTLPAQIQVLRQQNNRTLLQIILTEGRNRQIRRVAQQLGFPVLSLHRTAIDGIQLQALPTGRYRFLKLYEIKLLKNRLHLNQGEVATPLEEHSL